MATIFLTLSGFVFAGEEICSLSDNLVCGPNTEIVKLGVLDDKYSVYNYTYIFGESHRMVKRVIFTGENNVFVGMYSVSDLPTEIEGTCVLFDVSSELGNTICLNNSSLPNKTLVDGENIELFW